MQSGRTVLHLAAAYGSTEVVLFLLKHDGDFFSRDLVGALHQS
jgi:ankyrin repeat protein